MRTDRPPRLANGFHTRIVAEIPRVRAFLGRLAPGEAEDLLQEVLARSLRYQSAFREDGSLRSWMLRTAFRVFLDCRERANRRPEDLGDLDVEIPAGGRSTTSHAVEQVERRLDLDRLLERLSDRERDVLLWFHRDGRTIREISEELAIPEGTVKSHLHRARRKLASLGSREEEELET